MSLILEIPHLLHSSMEASGTPCAPQLGHPAGSPAPNPWVPDICPRPHIKDLISILFFSAFCWLGFVACFGLTLLLRETLIYFQHSSESPWVIYFTTTATIQIFLIWWQSTQDCSSHYHGLLLLLRHFQRSHTVSHQYSPYIPFPACFLANDSFEFYSFPYLFSALVPHPLYPSLAPLNPPASQFTIPAQLCIVHLLRHQLFAYPKEGW